MFQVVGVLEVGSATLPPKTDLLIFIHYLLSPVGTSQ